MPGAVVWRQALSVRTLPGSGSEKGRITGPPTPAPWRTTLSACVGSRLGAFPTLGLWPAASTGGIPAIAGHYWHSDGDRSRSSLSPSPSHAGCRKAIPPARATRRRGDADRPRLCPSRDSFRTPPEPDSFPHHFGNDVVRRFEASDATVLLAETGALNRGATVNGANHALRMRPDPEPGVESRDDATRRGSLPPARTGKGGAWLPWPLTETGAAPAEDRRACEAAA
jgi:hypothetical protein